MARASSGNVSPRRFAPSNAARRKISAARLASPRASVIGLPTSATIICASSSARCSHKSAARFKMAARSCAGIFAINFAPCSAAASASSTSAAEAMGTESTTSPLYGERTSAVFFASRHCPAMRIFIVCFSLFQLSTMVKPARLQHSRKCSPPRREYSSGFALAGSCSASTTIHPS